MWRDINPGITPHPYLVMLCMEYDNDRDRFSNDYDAGISLSGIIELDQNTGEFVIVDENGLAVSTQFLFKSLLGKEVRFTCMPMDTIYMIQNILSSPDLKIT